MATLSTKTRILRRVLPLLAALLFGVPLRADLADRPTIHAVFTLNVAHFVTWPPDSLPPNNGPLVIGTVERDPVNPALDAAASRESIAGRQVRTMRIRDVDDIGVCQVVFLSRDMPLQGPILARAKNRPILLVGDSPGFLELGGHVAFVTRSSRVTLVVSRSRMKSSGLGVRAQLLRLAELEP